MKLLEKDVHEKQDTIISLRFVFCRVVCLDLFFDHEYLREFEAKIGKKRENPPHCHVPFSNTVCLSLNRCFLSRLKIQQRNTRAEILACCSRSCWFCFAFFGEQFAARAHIFRRFYGHLPQVYLEYFSQTPQSTPGWRIFLFLDDFVTGQSEVFEISRAQLEDIKSLNLEVSTRLAESQKSLLHKSDIIRKLETKVIILFKKKDIYFSSTMHTTT